MRIDRRRRAIGRAFLRLMIASEGPGNRPFVFPGGPFSKPRTRPPLSLLESPQLAQDSLQISLRLDLVVSCTPRFPAVTVVRPTRLLIEVIARLPMFR